MNSRRSARNKLPQREVRPYPGVLNFQKLIRPALPRQEPTIPPIWDEFRPRHEVVLDISSLCRVVLCELDSCS